MFRPPAGLPGGVVTGNSKIKYSKQGFDRAQNISTPVRIYGWLGSEEYDAAHVKIGTGPIVTPCLAS